MNAGERRTACIAPSGPDRTLIDVSAAGAYRQRTFRLTQNSAGVSLEMKEFGQLQTIRLGQFTGRARLRLVRA